MSRELVGYEAATLILATFLMQAMVPLRCLNCSEGRDIG
jgi:hypothetical protein